MENTTFGNGYDLEVYGLKDGKFYQLHIPAITCIILSFISALTVIIFSFRTQNVKNFFNWTKSERFVVYLAVCDGLFNVAHSMDHLHIVITHDHVRPLELCQFYGFTLAEFISAQNLMVNIIAINAFVLIYYRKQLEFGRYDWKLLLWTFGLPFLGATVAGIAGQLGPNGAFCYFDGVRGGLTNIFFTTVPLLLVLIINIVLYALTWHKIRTESKRMKGTLGRKATTVVASHRIAKTMSMFVTAFFVQWWAMAFYGLWQLITSDVPQIVFQFVTTFSNIGGILNGIIYIIIRHRKKTLSRKSTTSELSRDKDKCDTNAIQGSTEVTSSH